MNIIKVMKHPLNAAQAAELAGNEIVNLKDINPELAAALENTPDDWNVLHELSLKLIEICKDYEKAILPVGSPAFMWLLAQNWDMEECEPIFAHSVSNSTEKEVEEFVETAPGSAVYEKKLVVKKTVIFNHVRFF